MYVHTHLWDRRRSRRHPSGTGVRRNSSVDGVTPINNPDACRTCWVSYRLPRTMLVARRSFPPAKAGQGNCGKEALARGLFYLTFDTSMHYFSREKHWHSFYTGKNLYPRKLSIDTISPKMRKFNTTKICTLTVASLHQNNTSVHSI